MDSNPILTQVSGAIGTITLNRPMRGNSLTSGMVEQLKKAIKDFEADANVRVIILTGKGKFFCTGMDLGGANQSEMRERAAEGKAAAGGIELFQTLYKCSKPLVTKINGPAYGGGWGLIFASDIRVALNSAHFALPEVKRGLLPAIISLFIVPQIGPFLSKQIMLSGSRISADRALQLGLLSAICSSEEELEKVTQSHVAELLTSGPDAMRRIKALVDFVADHSHEQNLKMIEKVFTDMMVSEEAMYGIMCYAQKQTPNWGEFVQQQRSKL